MGVFCRKSPALAQSSLQKNLFNLVLAELLRFCVVTNRLPQIAELAQEIGFDGVEQVVRVKVTTTFQLVDARQTVAYAVRHSQRNRRIEFHHGRWLQIQQSLVQERDLGPIGLLRPARCTMERCNRCLHLEWTGISQSERCVKDALGFGDFVLLPEAAILIVEENHLVVR